ncbi:MAG: hypothetical protein HUJ96_01230 [Marinilabiliaceae bacterium]|nr:hypothetical protein [Marinilabiliaceae bacterium]
MKKFLLALAAIAMGGVAVAQTDYLEILKANASDYTAGALLESEDAIFTVTLGEDTFEAKMKEVEEGDGGDSKIGAAGWNSQITGKANPQNGSDPKTDKYSKSGELPTQGCYYIVESTQAGYIWFWGILNSDKALYILESSSKAPVARPGVADQTYNGLKVTEKVYAGFPFAVEVGKKYYVFCEGSKLGFMGARFTKETPTAIKNVSADAEVLSVEYYNLAGVKIDAPTKGINIVKTSYSDGSVVTDKLIK